LKIRHTHPTAVPTAKLAELVYELLDAHDDTLRLREECASEERWAAHIDYLRQLQRVGRGTLARDSTATVDAPATRLGHDVHPSSRST
jgi:hypothetical protein